MLWLDPRQNAPLPHALAVTLCRRLEVIVGASLEVILFAVVNLSLVLPMLVSDTDDPQYLHGFACLRESARRLRSTLTEGEGQRTEDHQQGSGYSDSPNPLRWDQSRP